MYFSQTLTAILGGLVSITSAAPAAVEQRAGIPSPFGGENGPAPGGLGKQRPKPQPQKAPAQDTTSTITTTTYTTVTIPPGPEATTGVGAADADTTASLGSETFTLVVGNNDGSVITVAPASPATTAPVS